MFKRRLFRYLGLTIVGVGVTSLLSSCGPAWPYYGQDPFPNGGPSGYYYCVVRNLHTGEKFRGNSLFRERSINRAFRHCRHAGYKHQCVFRYCRYR